MSATNFWGLFLSSIVKDFVIVITSFNSFINWENDSISHAKVFSHFSVYKEFISYFSVYKEFILWKSISFSVMRNDFLFDYS